MAHSFSAIYAHIVFSTKGREPWLDAEWRPALWRRFDFAARTSGQVLLAAGGVADHVHLLISVTRVATPCNIVRKIKGKTTQWCRNTGKNPAFEWQDGYGYFSVSHSGLDVVRLYLAGQEARHAEGGYQGEFRTLLRKHQIPFKEEEIWD